MANVLRERGRPLKCTLSYIAECSWPHTSYVDNKQSGVLHPAQSHFTLLVGPRVGMLPHTAWIVLDPSLPSLLHRTVNLYASHAAVL